MRHRHVPQWPGVICMFAGTILGSIVYAGAGSWPMFFAAMLFLLLGMWLIKLNDKSVARSKEGAERSQ